MSVELPQSLIEFFQAIPAPSEDCDKEFVTYVRTQIVNCDKAYSYLHDKYGELCEDPDASSEVKQLCRDSALSSKAASVMFELTLAYMDHTRNEGQMPDELIKKAGSVRDN